MDHVTGLVLARRRRAACKRDLMPKVQDQGLRSCTAIIDSEAILPFSILKKTSDLAGRHAGGPTSEPDQEGGRETGELAGGRRKPPQRCAYLEFIPNGLPQFVIFMYQKKKDI